MKTFVPALFVALAGVASAQLADLPQCSLQCFLTALGSDGCSQLTDFKCHCEKSDTLFSSVTPCVQKACTADEQAEVITGVQKTCAQAGVTISVPVPSAAATTKAPESSAAESSAEATESSAESTKAPESSAAESSAPAATSSYEAEPTSSEVAPASSVSVAPSPSANGTVGTAAPVPTTSEFPGAASRIGAAAGLVGAAALAVFAL
ncbi:CFEM-domain-containing protein [Bimuria novae-zelandiae CBS 107.79]|uniref:CFEM-domain-containing protein n=1 Tax=Bimuria novae-zelandiae CBS 107.79 TaxID=1447943 RepID=A0A6A5VI05_9PLEO|nr:CFEM-domain-containing protein [Bimuria novae-zelandiae CBS 107.79]